MDQSITALTLYRVVLDVRSENGESRADLVELAKTTRLHSPTQTKPGLCMSSGRSPPVDCLFCPRRRGLFPTLFVPIRRACLVVGLATFIMDDDGWFADGMIGGDWGGRFCN